MSRRPVVASLAPEAVAAVGDDEGRPVPAGRCGVCRQPLVAGACPNTVCHLPDRAFSQVLTISEDADGMWDLIRRYKYDEDKALSEDLARLLVEYFESDRERVERFDLITTCALYIGPRAPRLWDYLRLVIDAADRIDPGWPFAPDLITKSRPTGRFLGIGVEERRRIAEGELRAALAVPEPERVAGRRVLVLDDVYSEGFSLREMARALRRAGAVEVAGLVFCRKKGA
jgi:predicted amidophosphoribosyltransferase